MSKSEPPPTVIARDIRGGSASREVSEFYEAVFRPGQNHLWTASDLDVSPDGEHVWFTGQTFRGTLDQGPSNLIARLDLASGIVEQHFSGRLYRSSPDGRSAYIEEADDGRENLVVLSPAGDRLRHLPLHARVEAMAWSPSGRDLMVLAADAGADVSGAEGGFALRSDEAGPSWLPEITSSAANDLWRRLYRLGKESDELALVTRPPVNVWEAGWLGDDALLVIASDHHSEGSWYQATCRIIDSVTGVERERHAAADQIGLPAGSPDGRRWAAVTAFCSDRGIVCGTLIIGEGETRRPVDLDGAEVSDIRWRDDHRLLFAGMRGDQTVVGEIDTLSGWRRELWASTSHTIGGWYPKAVPLGEDGALAVIEAYAVAPAVARLIAGHAEIVADFTPVPAASIAGSIRYHRWQGRDGLEIGGWLVLPEGEARDVPLFVDIHGGPIWAHRNRYAAGLRAGPVLVAKGYALLLPNPRGSSGSGQDFARRVQGDMGGEDTHDYLAGIESLVDAGIVDPARVAVSGTSYGGFMTSWLVTQTNYFAAAVPISPVANWYSQHFASQIPWFDEAFLKGSPRRAGGQYFDRSPVFFARNVSTPTLILAGGRDKNTPTGQAHEFFGALTEAGATAALAIYPEDGHSLRGYPAYLDSAARIVDWLQRYIAA